MVKIYACLVGEWVCLNDDPDCLFVDYNKSPSVWWEENAKIYAPTEHTSEMADTFYHLNYVKILYKGKIYRINPIFIQIVE